MIKVRWVYYSVLLAVVFSCLIYLPYLLTKEIQFSPIELPSEEQNCTDELIKKIWVSIFQENSEDILILTNTTECSPFAAYKIKNENEFFLLYGSYSTQITETKTVNAIKAKITPEYLQRVQNLSIDLSSGILKDNTGPMLIDFNGIETIPLNYLIEEQSSAEKAIPLLESIYKIAPIKESSTQIIEEKSILLYSLNTQTKIVNISSSRYEKNTSISGAYFLNYSFNRVTPQEKTSIIEMQLSNNLTNAECNSNWTITETKCTQDETYTTYYIDSNACNSSASEEYGTISTKSCDYNKNNIMGKKDWIKNKNLEIEAYINQILLNDSKNYTSTQRVELKESNITRVSFDYNFRDPLDLGEIQIEKQSPNSKYNYLIVKGINTTKTIILDRHNSSNKICILDKHVENISEFTENCSSSEETLLACPESKNQFSCDKTEKYYLVSGLSKSAVKEIIPTATNLSLPKQTCISNWSCSFWSDCSSTEKTRTCTDLNNCKNNNTMPSITESCVSLQPACTPNWDCTLWKPESCPKEKRQIRICTDLSLCAVDLDKPEEIKECKYEESNGSIVPYVLISLAGVIIAAIITLFFLIRKSANAHNQRINNNKQNLSFNPQIPPPNYPRPQNPGNYQNQQSQQNYSKQQPPQALPRQQPPQQSYPKQQTSSNYPKLRAIKVQNSYSKPESLPQQQTPQIKQISQNYPKQQSPPRQQNYQNQQILPRQNPSAQQTPPRNPNPQNQSNYPKRFNNTR